MTSTPPEPPQAPTGPRYVLEVEHLAIVGETNALLDALRRRGVELATALAHTQAALEAAHAELAQARDAATAETLTPDGQEATS